MVGRQVFKITITKILIQGIVSRDSHHNPNIDLIDLHKNLEEEGGKQTQP